MKKAPTVPSQGRKSLALKYNTPNRWSKLGPRQMRLLRALMDGPVTREQADRRAPASNAPHYVGTLRGRLGLELPCRRVDCITKDGEASWYGIYHATPKDREIIRDFLAALDGEEE